MQNTRTTRSTGSAKIALGATLAALLVAGVAGAAVTKSAVRGRLAAADDASAAKGKFHLTVKERADAEKGKLKVWAKGLDATADDDGHLPEYDLFLLDADGDETDFGALTLHANGKARFRLHTSVDDLPEGVESLDEFSAGELEIRDADGNVVLSGDIPAFVGLDDENGAGSGAAARGKDKSRLHAEDADSHARGLMLARYANKPSGIRELIAVRVWHLDPDSGPYDVVVIDGETELDVGQIETDGRRERGKLVLDSREEDLPGDDSVLDLAGQDVEVRDANGTVVLEGEFPTIE